MHSQGISDFKHSQTLEKHGFQELLTFSFCYAKPMYYDNSYITIIHKNHVVKLIDGIKMLFLFLYLCYIFSLSVIHELSRIA